MIVYWPHNYIIGICGAAGVVSTSSTTTHSVIIIIEATDAAFSIATLVTLVGSIIPDLTISHCCPVRAS